MTNNLLPVAVIGAGPVGLAAAAHLLERGETPLVFERAPQVGGNLQEWAHVRMFSSWEYNLDRASVDLLESYGWQSPPLDELPTGGDMLQRYLIPFAELPVIRDFLRLNTSVIAISRRGIDKMKDAGREDAPFVLHVRDNATGDEELIEAKAVIDASGTWSNPNPIGSGGLFAPGEAAFADRIFYGIPDVLNGYRTRYAGKRVAVIGSGHSAINALLDLARLPDTRITWVLRKAPRATYGGGEADALPARGQLGIRIKKLVDSGALQVASSFRVLQLKSVDGAIQIIGETSHLLVDEIIAATGSRPDLNMLRELRLSLDPALESVAALGSLIDPNIHSCGTVRPHGEAELRHPEPNFYTVGVKSYGRAPTFLLATGYEQVRSVVAGLVGDWEAARRVELNLPETGVCSSSGAGSDCCGGGESVVQSTLLPINAIPVSFNGGLAVAAQPLVVTSACCGAEKQSSCCAVEAKAECCGATAETGTCGCA